MLLRKSVVNIAASPVLSAAIIALARSSVRTLLADVGAISALTDNSTGVGAASLAAVPIQSAKVAQSGANMADRAEFNTAIGKINNACSVLMEHLNDNGFTPLGFTPFGEGDGTIAVSGTVAACDKSVTGVDADGVPATGTLSAAGTIADGNTVTIGSKTYTFQDTLTNVDGNVKVGVDDEASLANLAAAINLGAGSGTAYAAATTANTQVTATSNATTLTATAIDGGTAGNAIATTTTGGQCAWAAATLTGGAAASECALRSEVNAAIIVQRNNIATLTAAYNELAYAIGVTELSNATGGTANPARTLDDLVTADTATDEVDVPTNDLATKAAVDLALDALADNIATLCDKIDNPLFLTATMSPSTDTTVALSR